MDKKQAKVIKSTLKALGKKNLSLIIHGGSFPSRKGENTGFGTPNSNGAKDLIDYISGVFNSIQLGPSGKTKSGDSSPYTSTIFSNNPLFVDLKQLTTKDWDYILSEETFNRIVEENPNKDVAKTAYSYIYKAQDTALQEAFENFKTSDKLKKARKEFEVYKLENKFWLETDALYSALSIEHSNDYWPLWQNETDKNLYDPKSYEDQAENSNRLDEIEKKYADEIEFYMFIQYVISKQNDETKHYAKSKKIKMIADRQVAFSDRDTWAYKSMFLEGWSLGCPPDYFSKNGQAWGFPVMNPELLFKKDGSLDKGGILMKNLFKKMFKENPGGVRIDHIVGLIDPWVYKSNATPRIEDGAGRLYSSPEHSELSKFAIPTEANLNPDATADNEQRIINLTDKQIKEYGRLIEKIVIAAAKEEGLSKNDIVCEDLGTLTNPVAAVMKKYDLLGMRLTQFVVPTMKDHPYRMKNIPKRSWMMVGTHDNQPIKRWANSLVNTHEAYLHAKNLVEDLYSYVDNKDDVIVRLTQDADFLAEAKMIELFASESENIQIFFTDYFNINETYNTPGTSGDKNWSLRLTDDFANLTPINLPLILKKAILARGEEFAHKNHKLVEKLEEFETI